MPTTNTDLAVVEGVVEGEVLDGPTFDNLYRLLDLERSATEEWQRLSLPAAAEVLRAWESDEWKDDKQAEWDAYVADHNVQPSWRPTSELSFVAWMQKRAERDGHEFRSRMTILQLRNAAQCIRIMKSNRADTAVSMPQTEDAWRPAYKLLRHGYEHAIPALVRRAAEIAEGEGKPITQVIMFEARKEVWANDPEIQKVERRGHGHPDQATAHDKAIKARHEAERWVKALMVTNDWTEIDAFDKWYAEFQRNIKIARREATR